MRVRRYLTRRRNASSVDVSAFLSLMVILVPFLLITAIFSRLSVLELQGVSEHADGAVSQDPLQLKVIVRERVIEVRYLGGEQQVQRIARTGGAELDSLSKLMVELKRDNPQSTEATILLEPQVPYGELVQLVDSVRLFQRLRDGTLEQDALFPRVSLAETPVLAYPGLESK